MQKFLPEVNEIFQPIRKKQAGTLCLSVATTLLKFAILIQTQKAIDSISLADME